MAQAAKSLGLDLANTLAGYAHLATNLFECIGLSVEQTVAQLQNADLARRKPFRTSPRCSRSRL